MSDADDPALRPDNLARISPRLQRQDKAIFTTVVARPLLGVEPERRRFSSSREAHQSGTEQTSCRTRSHLTDTGLYRGSPTTQVPERQSPTHQDARRI